MVEIAVAAALTGAVAAAIAAAAKSMTTPIPSRSGRGTTGTSRQTSTRT